jgi:hypothetical protein
LIADSVGLATGAGTTDNLGDSGLYVVSGGTAGAAEPNTSGSAIDSAEVAFDTIVVSGATELLADTGSGVVPTSSRYEFSAGKTAVGATINGDTADLRSGDVASGTVVGGGNLVGS